MNAVRRLDRKIVGVFGGTRNIKLAQGLEIVLAALHKRLAGHFRAKYPSLDKDLPEQLATAVLNDLFARTTKNRQAAGFVLENRGLLEESLASLAKEVPELCKEITMALYVRGIIAGPDDEDSRALFERATKLGIFRPEVTIPQPKEYFEHAVRMAQASGLGSAD